MWTTLVISVCVHQNIWKHSSSLLNAGNAIVLAKTLQKFPSWIDIYIYISESHIRSLPKLLLLHIPTIVQVRDILLQPNVYMFCLLAHVELLFLFLFCFSLVSRWVYYKVTKMVMERETEEGKAYNCVPVSYWAITGIILFFHNDSNAHHCY